MAKSLIHEGDEDFYQVTGCKPCCKSNEISAKLYGREVIEKDNDFASYYIEDEENYVVFDLYYGSSKVIVKEEYSAARL